MAERIDIPPTLQGDEKSQLEQMWRYLYQLSESINNNLEAIGGNDLTDTERATMQQILAAAGGGDAQGAASDYETLKSLIIKTADFVQTSLQEYRMKLLGETVASGQFGRYVRQTGLDVEVTPTGITQNYSLREIAEDLKHYEVNAKNYIKTGLLRTVSSIPVYGVAIGKDIVTFSNDGTETYNDGNKVAELTADELSFWQGGEKIAGYTGSRISFYYNNAEVFYIQQGKLYSAQDLELSAGNKLIIGNWSFSENGVKCENTSQTYGRLDMSIEYIPNYNALGFYLDQPQIGETYFAYISGDNYRYQNQTFIRLQSKLNTNIVSVTEVWAKDIEYIDLHQHSSRESKRWIQDMEEMGNKLDQLRPVTFVYKDDPQNRRRGGLIYEETQPVLPEICTAKGNTKAINYLELVPMLLKEIQDLRARVKALEER